MQGYNKGNLLLTYLFASGDVIDNMNIEKEMIADIQKLAEKWKSKGYIKRYVIADDECISDNVKQHNKLSKVDYRALPNCKNLEKSYEEICVKCGKCKKG